MLHSFSESALFVATGLLPQEVIGLEDRGQEEVVLALVERGEGRSVREV